MELTGKLRSFRRARKITQEELADAMGVTAQAVSKWERGTAMPDISLLPELAVYFGVSLDELFGLSEEKEYDRIQNILWDKRLLPHAEFDQAERWLDEKIAAGYRKADCYRLKADLYNHQAGFLHEMAETAAKAALEADPACHEAHGELNTAMGGYIPDWCARNHYREIRYYREFVKKHPEDWRAFMWLLDNLLDDSRFEEAEEALAGLQAANQTYRPQYYRGLLLKKQGKRAEAHAVWDQMLEDFAEDWRVWFSMADEAVSDGAYDEAIERYRRGIGLQKAPRYVDGFESIAMIHEIRGEYDKAVRVLQEELEVLKTEWDTTQGETADSVRRKIRSLETRTIV
ncbi:MAG: helix-turn-helix domain-containing protein [Solobacterium sp.]|nr:helix-turn-helix domain-containing protein [Solobacterium sp.]